MIEELTLKEANKNIERLENDLNYYLNQKEALFNKTQPKATDIQIERVDGGRRIDKFSSYVISMEEKELNEKIDSIQNEINNLVEWVNEELRILDKYNETERLIVYYKEEYISKRPIAWYQIARKVHYSETQCRNIYRRYKRKRNI